MSRRTFWLRCTAQHRNSSVVGLPPRFSTRPFPPCFVPFLPFLSRGRMRSTSWSALLLSTSVTPICRLDAGPARRSVYKAAASGEPASAAATKSIISRPTCFTTATGVRISAFRTSRTCVGESRCRGGATLAKLSCTSAGAFRDIGYR